MVWHTGVAGLYAVMQKNKGEFVKSEGLFWLAKCCKQRFTERVTLQI